MTRARSALAFNRASSFNLRGVQASADTPCRRARPPPVSRVERVCRVELRWQGRCRWNPAPRHPGRTGPLSLSLTPLTHTSDTHTTVTPDARGAEGEAEGEARGTAQPTRTRHAPDARTPHRTDRTLPSPAPRRGPERTRLSPLASMAGVARRSRRCGRGLASADCPRAAPAACRDHDSVLRGAPPAPPRARVGSHRRLAAHGC